MTTQDSWPQGADGDVFRRLASKGFDFAAEHEIEFNVDFDDWPPPPTAMAWLKQRFSAVRVVEPEVGTSGYVQFKVYSALTYLLVTEVQAEVSDAMATYGGICESWGLLS